MLSAAHSRTIFGVKKAAVGGPAQLLEREGGANALRLSSACSEATTAPRGQGARRPPQRACRA